MGFFSWKTADTKESMPNTSSELYEVYDSNNIYPYLLVPREGIKVPFKLMPYTESFTDARLFAEESIMEGDFPKEKFINWVKGKVKEKLDEIENEDEGFYNELKTAIENNDKFDYWLGVTDDLYLDLEEFFLDYDIPFKIKKNIKEPAYDGYGRFGGFDVYELLFFMNLDNTKQEVIDMILKTGESKPIIREIGIDISFKGGAYLLKETGKILVRGEIGRRLSEVFPNIMPAPFYFDEKIEGIGKSLNELISLGEVEEIDLRNIYLKNPDEFKPLKFSFNPYAVYEELPASEECEYQGFFYDDEYILEIQNRYRFKGKRNRVKRKKFK